MQIAAFWHTFSQKINSCNTTHFHFSAYYVHPAWGNTKNGTRATTTTGHGTEGPDNGTSRQKWDKWQP